MHEISWTTVGADLSAPTLKNHFTHLRKLFHARPLSFSNSHDDTTAFNSPALLAGVPVSCHRESVTRVLKPQIAKSSTYMLFKLPSMALDPAYPCRNDGA